jgi:hypothetical protein
MARGFCRRNLGHFPKDAKMRQQDRWLRWLPGIVTLRQYRGEWLPHEIFAGLVLTTMLVPVGMAYAVASGVPGIYGLYATIIPLLAYAVLGPVAFSSWRTHRSPPSFSASCCRCRPATHSAPWH